MSLYLSFFFILSFNVIIFNLPSSHGNDTGYHVSTISQELTLGEYLTYLLTGSLPNRFKYSHSKGCYVISGQAGLYKNDLKRKNGKGYKAIPRWKYYLSKLSPVQTAKDILSLSKALTGFGGKNYGDFGSSDDVNLDNPDDDSDNDTDGGPKNGIMQMAEDVLESDTAKEVAMEVAKTGIELLVPGGPVIVGAINKYEESQKKAEAVENVVDKVPKFK
ncbi:uncharacterized protein LOC114132136 isoform X2 [Aphis gossypii]|uniref:Uncharacterized protein n=1 Tax=Aphis gossypii TaxID=80765 RepID=A0A9P0JBH1_APHGO|nr:uncharacterized protein LOC114132136 isoform X2 [Aphis gossypii]CAH1732670.1 unnamed protein product [Aphis gossypii]